MILMVWSKMVGFDFLRVVMLIEKVDWMIWGRRWVWSWILMLCGCCFCLYRFWKRGGFLVGGWWKVDDDFENMVVGMCWMREIVSWIVLGSWLVVMLLYCL